MTHARRTIITALVLVVMAIAASAADARPADDPSLPLGVAQGDAYTPTADAPALPLGVTRSYAYTADVANVSSPSSPSADATGFDWGDAAIGGGAIFGLTLIGLGGTLFMAHRRHSHTGPAATV
jgi:hypothetical protein